MIKYKPQVLRSLDTSEGIVDPLDTNVNDIDTSFPVIMPGIVEMVVDSAEKTLTKDGVSEQIVMKLKTTGETRSIKGDVINAGYPLTKRMMVTPKGGMTVDMIKRGVAQVAKGLGISGTVRDIINNPAMLVGKVAPWTVVVRKPTAEYPNPANDVTNPVGKA